MIDASVEKFGISLKPIERKDLEMIRGWRNHPEVARHMFSQHYISTQDQIAWYEQLQVRKDVAQWLIYYLEDPIGVASLTAADQQLLSGADTAEAGFYLAPDRYRGTALAFAPALALNSYALSELGINKLIARVRKENDAARRFNIALGYQLLKEQHERDDFFRMILTPDEHAKALKRLARFFQGK